MGLIYQYQKSEFKLGTLNIKTGTLTVTECKLSEHVIQTIFIYVSLFIKAVYSKLIKCVNLIMPTANVLFPQSEKSAINITPMNVPAYLTPNSIRQKCHEYCRCSLNLLLSLNRGLFKR